MLEIGFSIAVGTVAVLLTLVVVAALLPTGAALGGGATLAFLPLSGVLSGFSAWRWVRWFQSRAHRLHWSVIASAGAAVTVSELYALAGVAAADFGLADRLSGVAVLGLLMAVTVALTGVTSLTFYQRSVTDERLAWLVARRCASLTALGAQ